MSTAGTKRHETDSLTQSGDSCAFASYGICCKQNIFSPLFFKFIEAVVTKDNTDAAFVLAMIHSLGVVELLNASSLLLCLGSCDFSVFASHVNLPLAVTAAAFSQSRICLMCIQLGSIRWRSSLRQRPLSGDLQSSCEL